MCEIICGLDNRVISQRLIRLEEPAKPRGEPRSSPLFHFFKALHFALLFLLYFSFLSEGDAKREIDKDAYALIDWSISVRSKTK